MCLVGVCVGITRDVFIVKKPEKNGALETIGKKGGMLN